MLLFLVIMAIFIVPSAVEGHGDPTGRSKTSWTYTGCCGDSRTGYEKVVETEYDEPVRNPASPKPTAESGEADLSPGLHWHKETTYPCVNRHHWGYHSSCDTPRYSCEDEWVRITPHFKSCNVSLNPLDAICNANAGNAYDKVSWNCPGNKCYYYRWEEQEVCKDRIVP
jgi:hypothetical protein